MSRAGAPIKGERAAFWSAVNVVYVMLDRYEDAPDETIASLASRLSSCVRPARAERSRGLRRPIDRLASLAAGALIDIAVAPFTYQHIVPIVVGVNDKPDFAGGFGLHFSLSHCRKAACCVVSQHLVGIDVEGLVDPYEDLSAMCLTATERTHLEGYPNRAERICMFTRLWTREEALGKYLGCGLDESVLQIDSLRWPAHAASLLAVWHMDDICETAPWVKTFGLPGAYLSVCGHGRVHMTSYSLDEVLTVFISGTCSPSWECE
ncbi:MAG: 4'-phosphopantetheinyl transferase superfamily protein [Coriobacteriales bacterium]|jgi:phosphopantetheinyl transferase|nr:4'-phosphopantetheinyl transferase superfamily protein [Coriobacteriales bacterium]